MDDDQTEPPFPADVAPPANQTKTETKIETIETEVPGRRHRHPGELFGMSGRFWVTILSVIGSTVVIILALKSDMQNETKAVTIGAYMALSASVANTYMGQNAGPTKPKPS